MNDHFLSSYGGMAASLGAAMLWSFSVSIYRIYGTGRSASWLNLFKGLIALICIGIVALVTDIRGVVTPEVFWTLTISGMVGGLVGDTAFFAALFRIGATLTSTIQSLVPTLTAVLAYFVLGQTLRGMQIAGLIVTSGCLGALLFFEAKSARKNDKNQRQDISSAESHFSELSPLPEVKIAVERNQTHGRIYATGVFFALLAALCQAVGAVVAKPALGTLSPFLVSAIRLWLPAVILIGWQARKVGSLAGALKGMVSGPSLIIIACGSFAGTFLGLTLMMYGMAHAPLGVAFALNSTYPVWILVGERIFGGKAMGLRASLLVVGSVSGIWLMI